MLNENTATETDMVLSESPSNSTTVSDRNPTTATSTSKLSPAAARKKVTMCPSVVDKDVMVQDDIDVEVGRKTMITATEDLPRLVLRNRPFHQSSNKVYIQHSEGWRIYTLLRFNFFHTMLRWPTKWSLLALMSLWTAVILFFAAVYCWYDRLDTTISCGLGKVEEPVTWATAFAFSLETCTTVGYGLPNGVNSYFEEGCQGLQIIIYFQMACSMVFNAFLITFLYARVGRAEERAAQVICSNKALVSMVDGQVRFQIRVFDADAKHPVVEAHVRLYAVMKHRPVPRPLRLLQPDDELGGMLFLSFPSVINHHIDLYSLLHPPSKAVTTSSHGLNLRQVDADTSNRDDVVCPICGESYGTMERWKNHVRYNQIQESKDEWPIEGSHQSLNLQEIIQQTELRSTENLEELKEYFAKNVSEVICVVEGIDPLQSGTFQALQSYRYEDIVWDDHSQFAPCLTVAETNKARVFQVDLERYHDIVPDQEALETSKIAVRASTNSKPARRKRIKTVSKRESDGLFDA